MEIKRTIPIAILGISAAIIGCRVESQKTLATPTPTTQNPNEQFLQTQTAITHENQNFEKNFQNIAALASQKGFKFKNLGTNDQPQEMMSINQLEQEPYLILLRGAKLVLSANQEFHPPLETTYDPDTFRIQISYFGGDQRILMLTRGQKPVLLEKGKKPQELTDGETDNFLIEAYRIISDVGYSINP